MSDRPQSSAGNDRGMSPLYDAASVEQRIYTNWESTGTFCAQPKSLRQPYALVIPPPNVTGVLHLGHAWDQTLQDILARYHRLRGDDVLWLPGTDHAGIATQTRVERTLLEEEGLRRHDIGREAFVAKVWEWKAKYGDTITSQIRRLGGSVDWSRERFTMDEGLSKAVRTVFVRLYEKGLIYRGNRIINWCARCGTALSDIEVEHVETEGHLYYVDYPTVDGQETVTIATTRPETMFGDVAVAVHPDDARYAGLIGKSLRLPLAHREIPVIADEYVDPAYGTGCVKITPAHDPNDFEVGERHHLLQLQCMNADGRMTELAGDLQGLDADTARVKTVESLEKQGFLRRVEKITHSVGHCSRCSTVVNPLLSLQWFVRMEELARPALKAAEERELQFVPDRFSKIFSHWLEDVRDWCISRQLWWGHRIPAWFCGDCEHVTVSVESPAACEHCGGLRLSQDEDVLDTWFSSALWPFSTMGWPDTTSEDFARYYPTSVMVTGYDILFFWVARMVFMGLEFTGTLPFANVVLHGLIRDAEGRKMSKSLGNGINPVDVIEEVGADALRFTLATGTAPGNDQRYSVEKLEGSRNFVNKLWNASRFVVMNVADRAQGEALAPDRLAMTDRWILDRLQETILSATRLLDSYEFGEAARTLYDFAWDDFCDWYIEIAKIDLYGTNSSRKETVQSVLTTVLTNLLQLLHPFIPFVTEEIWSFIPGTSGWIASSAWPIGSTEWRDEDATASTRLLQDVIRAIRNFRSAQNIPPSKQMPIFVRVRQEHLLLSFQEGERMMQRLCNGSELRIALQMDIPDGAATIVTEGADVYVPLQGLIDYAAERERLAGEEKRLVEEITRLETKLSNSQFVSRAPAQVVDGERKKLADYEERRQAVQARMSQLAKM
jgi:valyl-tRNA synthetase